MVFKTIGLITALSIICVIFLSNQNDLVEANDELMLNKNSRKEPPMMKKRRYSSPLKSRDIDVSMYSDWPTTDVSPLCETWAYLDDFSSFSTDESGTDTQNKDLKWLFLDSLSQLSHEKQVLLDSLLSNSNVIEKDDNDSTVTWSYYDSMDLALQSAKNAFLHKNSKSSSNHQTTSNELKGDTVHIRLLKYALSLRAHSPLCELHRTLARETAIKAGLYNQQYMMNPSAKFSTIVPEIFAVIIPSGIVVDTVQELTHVLTNFEEKNLYTSSNFSKDRFFLPDEIPWSSFSREQNDLDDQTEKDIAPTVVLYTHLGTSSFSKFYIELKRLNTHFVVRHMGAIDYEEKNEFVDGNIMFQNNSLVTRRTELQGYGIRLDIKNMEYRAYDDKHEGVLNMDEKEKSKEDEISLLDEFLAGINLNKLVSHVGIESENNLSSLHVIQSKLQQSHELQHDMEKVVPPTWQTRMLPLQAAAVISSSQDPLRSLQDISQNLPSRASALVNVHVSRSIIDAGSKIHEMPIMEAGDLMTGQPAPFGFFVNGKRIHVERPSFNIFELLHTLRKEDAILAKLEADFDFSSPGMYRALQESFEMGDKLSQPTKETRGKSSTSNQSGPIRIDVGRGGKGAIIYINNVEKEKQYEQFLPSLNALAYGYKQIRKNLYTILIVFDPLSGDDSEALRFALYLLQQNLPVRIGILMMRDEDLSLYTSSDKENWTSAQLPSLEDLNSSASTDAYLEIFKAGLSKFGSHASLSFLFYSMERFSEMKKDDSLKDLTIHTLVSLFAQFFTSKYGVSVDEVMRILQNTWNERKLPYSESYTKAIRFVCKKGIDHGMSFFNGIPLPKIAHLENDKEEKEIRLNYQEKALKVLNEETQHITKMVADGVISDKTVSIYAKLLSGLNLHEKFHPLLMEANDDEKTFINNSYLDGHSSTILPATCNSSEIFLAIDAILDLQSDTGIAIAEKFLSILKVLPKELSSSDECFSISYRILPNNQSIVSSLIAEILQLQGVDSSTIFPILLTFLHKENSYLSSIANLNDGIQRFVLFVRNEAELEEDEKNLILTEIKKGNEEKVANDQTFLYDSVISQNLITVNGRALKVNADLQLEDIKLLIDLEKSRANSLSDLFRPHASGQDELFSTVTKVSIYLSTLSASKPEKRTDVISQLKSLIVDKDLKENDFPLYFVWNDNESDEDEDRILKTKVTVILDPLSEPAQRAAPILIAIRDGLKLPVHVIFAPRTKIDGNEGLPLTTYYRFFANYEYRSQANVVPSFQNLPSNHVLTLRTDVPESWNAVQTYAVQDTDNLRCDPEHACGDDGFKQDNLENNVSLLNSDVTRVKFKLKSLMIFGQCYDVTTGDNPNGLQLTLTRDTVNKFESSKITGNKSAELDISEYGSISNLGSTDSFDIQDVHMSHFSDSLVMKNLGYWQLRANPGLWRLAIAEDTIGSKAYEVTSGKFLHGAFIETNKEDDTPSTLETVVIKDFVNRAEALFMKRTHKFTDSDLSLGESTIEKSKSKDEDIIHVFSLATGHLYERLLKIMMLSVTKRATTRVKFWLLENFLSPGFKASAIAMAQEIGCEVQFVTYKWPEWLRGQSEKQRIIWGYKILFLDVLFPLDVKKIIYVDADQVVRADLKELRDLDLKGAPYGYTPMCSSRESTLGFAFWRSGFWERHLRGKPYHISALYVVDLERFRKEKVGDTLRGTYQMLSADPNSLANLDQDLPNYAQHEVMIHSLPQEWLWCESWCSDATKAKAKTIDLCNNPLHKEPKLSMAKRVISGKLFKESWIELAEEVDSYERKYLQSAANISKQ